MGDAPAKQRDDSRNEAQPSMNGGEGNPYNRGVFPLHNPHPTLKPIRLTAHLARLILPPPHVDAHLLVPFAGAGSEIIGGILAGWPHVTGIEREPDYVAIAERRIAFWSERARLFSGDIDRILESAKPDGTDERQAALFT